MANLGIYGGWLTVNRFCNFRCPWCYAAGTEFKSEDSMPLDLAIDLVDLMHSVGIEDVILIGGETFFWKHIFTLASHIKSLGMTSTVVTNGWLLGFERFRDKVEKSDITSIDISVKAGNRQQHIDLVGFDGFDRVAEGMREASKWDHISVSTSTVINAAVLGNLDEVVRFAFENGARSMNLSVCGPAVSDGSFDTQYVPEVNDVLKSFMKAYPVINEVSRGNFSLEGILPMCVWPSEFHRVLEEREQVSYGCHFKTRSGLLFDRWGNIIPCNHLYEYSLGKFGEDFTDAASLARLWNQRDIVDFYDKMVAYPASACVSCKAFNECGGGCPLNWLIREPEEVIISLSEVGYET